MRINDLTTKYAYEDIITLVEGARENLDTIMLTKTMDAADIKFVTTLLRQIEKKRGMTKQIGVEALIEEAAGLRTSSRSAMPIHGSNA